MKNNPIVWIFCLLGIPLLFLFIVGNDSQALVFVAVLFVVIVLIGAICLFAKNSTIKFASFLADVVLGAVFTGVSTHLFFGNVGLSTLFIFLYYLFVFAYNGYLNTKDHKSDNKEG